MAVDVIPQVRAGLDRPSDRAAAAVATRVPDVAPASPVQQAVAALKAVDRAQAAALRALSIAGPEGGLPADRLVSLAASATGWDVAFLQTCCEVLSAMPLTWRAFDDGAVSWSQVRGVVRAARSLDVARRAELDRRLIGVIARGGEPDAVVEWAQRIADRLVEDDRSDDAVREARRAFFRMQPDLFGGADFWGHTDDVSAATIKAALEAAADAPVADPERLGADGTGEGAGAHDAGNPDDARDADGTCDVPASWRPSSQREAQLAEGLRRVCDAFLAGQNGGRSGPLHTSAALGVVVDVATLLAEPDTPCGCGKDRMGVAAAEPDDRAAPSTLLWSLAGGRRGVSSSTVRMLSCDAVRVPVLTDGDTVLAVGDANDPIPLAVRRAAAVRDQGCRFPGCRAPAEHVDLHHVVYRRHGGPTTLDNLISICRFHHTLVHDRGWTLRLDPKTGVLHVRRGRWRFTSHPRLRPPPAPPPAPDDPSAQEPSRPRHLAGRDLPEPRLPF